MKRTRFALIAMVAGLVGWAQAVPPPQAGAPQDGGAEEAEHGVARISVMQGEVSVRHGDAGELSAAALNAPRGYRPGGYGSEFAGRSPV